MAVAVVPVPGAVIVTVGTTVQFPPVFEISDITPLLIVTTKVPVALVAHPVNVTVGKA